MTEYIVHVTETTVSEYRVTADSEDAAIEKAEDMNIEGIPGEYVSLNRDSIAFKDKP